MAFDIFAACRGICGITIHLVSPSQLPILFSILVVTHLKKLDWIPKRDYKFYLQQTNLVLSPDEFYVLSKTRSHISEKETL